MDLFYRHNFQFVFIICHYEVQGNKIELKLSGIYQLQVYPDSVSLLRGNLNATRINREAQIDASVKMV
jgi:hypothetical protein